MTCSCIFFNKHNTPCKHTIWVMINEFKQDINCDILQQLYLTDEEIQNLHLGTCSHCANAKGKETETRSNTTSSQRKTLCARLAETSTAKPVALDGCIIAATKAMTLRPALPEPQNDPYWLVKKEGNISTCNGCFQKTLGVDVIARVELDYSVKSFDDGSKQWKLGTRPRYYHPFIECLRKRCHNLVLVEGDIRVDSSSFLTTDILSNLGL